ncbi:MAG TPA: DUF2961 domain-containing protein [Candidatus Hydrogenedentes bacterium]|nr:DUF2961 domain-containing protein [Candidatus Hydrogenedentota bacterium]HIJ74676.1 DUF2961 domain-containing protein [Candidatus Hydrogenedentota bacterium]
MPEGVETRWASAENWKGEKGAAAQANAGRKGSAAFVLKAGEEKVLAEATGRSGMVRRIWVTLGDRSPEMLRGIRLDMYWDGASKPAVSAPVGDFFCHGLGRMATFENALFSSPEGRSFNCCVPMPFRTGMKIVARNETDKDQPAFFYDVDYTRGDAHGEEVAYFHAHYRRENPTQLQRDYELLPKLAGRGRFLGVNIGVMADTGRYFHSWWGEGEVKVYVDGDEAFPTLSGTGTEDYIGTGWGQGQYAHLYQGCHVADHEKLQYCFYRLHVPDPIYFGQDIRVTIQQIGCWGPDTKPLMHNAGKPIYLAGPGLREADLSESGNTGPYGLFERQDDWSSCAYFYLDKPESNLPPIEPFEKRVAGLGH